jgi:hypothetical protein
MAEKKMDRFVNGVGMDILDLLFSQSTPAHGETEVVIELPVGLDGIEENPIVIVNHTTRFPQRFP